MSWLYRVLRISISLVNIAVVVLVITSVWPFVTGEFSVDLPDQDEIEWNYVAGVLTLSAPFVINNGGFYSINDVVIYTTVVNSTGSQIIDSSEDWGTISAGSVFSETIDFSIDFANLISTGADWMIFHSDFLDIQIRITCRYTLGLIGFTADYVMPYIWDGLIIDFGFERADLANPSPGVYEVQQPYYIWTNSILSGFGGDFSVELRNASTASLIASSTSHISLGVNYSDILVLSISQMDYLYLLTTNDTLIATILIELPGLPSIEETRLINWIAPIYW